MAVKGVTSLCVFALDFERKNKHVILKTRNKCSKISIANSPLFMLLPYNIMIAGIPVVLAGPLKTN